MIKLQELTPAVYYEKSRDFQFIGRLYDIVLNYLKTNVETINALPIDKNIDTKLLTLLSLTLGFEAKHRYNSKQLLAVCSVLPRILRAKGSFNAILITVCAILTAEGIMQPLDYHVETKQSITLYLPQQLTDITLLNDLLDYILPAGISCLFVKEIAKTHPITTTLTMQDDITIYYDKPGNFGQILRPDDAIDHANIINSQPGGNYGMLANMIMSSDINTNRTVETAADTLYTSQQGDPTNEE